jgi:hypothetical protein
MGVLYTLVLICGVKLSPTLCWPDKADMSFQMGQDVSDPVEKAVADRRIDLRGRYILVRNISCGPGVAKVSKIGEGILPGDCRDIGTADGHCPSPLFRGKCPN